MKVYRVHILGDDDNCAYIAAPNAGRAKALALKTTTRRRIIELGARREPLLDGYEHEGPVTVVERLDGVDCEWWGVGVRF